MSWLPHYCLACEARLGPTPPATMDLCGHCRAALPWNEDACRRCAEPMVPGAEPLCGPCAKEPPPWANAIAPLRYEAMVARWVKALKFSGGLREGKVLGILLAEQVLAEAPDVDLLLPIPLSQRRLMRRGHNQAVILASSVHRATGIPMHRRTLVRARHTAAQSSLPASRRRRNIAAAFRCSPRVRNLRVALIDDVMTSGETLRSAAATVLAAGAASVAVWVSARTPAR